MCTVHRQGEGAAPHQTTADGPPLVDAPSSPRSQPHPEVPMVSYLGFFVREGAKNRIHKCAFISEESRFLLVGFPIFQILAAMADVPIAPDGHVRV